METWGDREVGGGGGRWGEREMGRLGRQGVGGDREVGRLGETWGDLGANPVQEDLLTTLSI